MRAYAKITAEIDELPSGPRIAAFFGFDGTIISGYSALVLMQEQIRRGELSMGQIAEAARAMASFGLGKSSFSAMMLANAQFMAGLEEADYVELGQDLFEKHIARLIYPESRALIEAHLLKGHTVAIVSSATVYQLQAAAESLKIPHVMCSKLEVKNGRFTGELVPPLCLGEGKLHAAEELAERCGADLAQSYFYSDSYDDIELLERVGNPRPINPDRKLREVAEHHAWPVRRFSSRGRPTVGQRLRSVLATGSLVFSAATGLPIQALTGSKREAQNFTASIYADIATALIGMKLNVAGEENLWKQRPAVFVFNHQSKADFIIIAKLLRRNFAGVARKHANAGKFFNQAMEMGGTVLIDLEQPRETIATLRSLAEDIKEQQISVAIAPEGTRSLTTRLGPFNTGGFNVALQAGVPVVPIVIHNALDVSPKGEFVYRPAIVDIDVLPPIDTSTWKKATLKEHMADVRQQFLDTLGPLHADD